MKPRNRSAVHAHHRLNRSGLHRRHIAKQRLSRKKSGERLDDADGLINRHRYHHRTGTLENLRCLWPIPLLKNANRPARALERSMELPPHAARAAHNHNRFVLRCLCRVRSLRFGSFDKPAGFAGNASENNVRQRL